MWDAKCKSMCERFFLLIYEWHCDVSKGEMRIPASATLYRHWSYDQKVAWDEKSVQVVSGYMTFSENVGWFDRLFCPQQSHILFDSRCSSMLLGLIIRQSRFWGNRSENWADFQTWLLVETVVVQTQHRLPSYSSAGIPLFCFCCYVKSRTFINNFLLNAELL